MEPPRPRSQSPNGTAGTASYDAAWCARDAVSSTQGEPAGLVGMIAGIAGGTLVLLVLVGCFCCRKKQRQKQAATATAADGSNHFQGNSNTMNMEQRGVVLTIAPNNSVNASPLPEFDEPSTVPMAGGRSLQPTVQETTFGSNDGGAGYLDVVNALVGGGNGGGGSSGQHQQLKEVRALPAKATAAKVCSERTSRGPCTNPAMVGSTRCKAHVCPHPGCDASKSSRAAFCPAHAASVKRTAPAPAKEIQVDAAQTATPAESVHPSNPFANTPSHSTNPFADAASSAAAAAVPPLSAVTAATAAAAATKPPATSATGAIAVGDKVTVDGYECSGTVRYIGPHLGDPAKGNRMLVELDEPVGKNNGTVKGVQFCAELPPKTGVLIKPTKAAAIMIKPAHVLNLAGAGVESNAYASDEEC